MGLFGLSHIKSNDNVIQRVLFYVALGLADVMYICIDNDCHGLYNETLRNP
jgi:hypothetical protein